MIHNSHDSKDDFCSGFKTPVIVNNNSSFQNYTNPEDNTQQTTDTPGFKPITVVKENDEKKKCADLITPLSLTQEITVSEKLWNPGTLWPLTRPTITLTRYQGNTTFF